MKTTTITIRVPPKVRKDFKMAALRKGKTMTDIILACIKREIKKDLKSCSQ